MSNIEKALSEFYKRQTRARKEMGVSSDLVGYENLKYTVTGDPNLFEGLGATPEELVTYMRRRLATSAAKIGLLSKWSLSALATEMSSHETNSNINSLFYKMKDLSKELPGNKNLEGTYKIVEDIKNRFEYLSRFNSYRSRSFGKVGSVIELVKSEFWQGLGSGKLAIEVSPELSSSTWEVDVAVFAGVLSNLVRNSYSIGAMKNVRPVIVRLGLEFEKVKMIGYNDETEQEFEYESEEPILTVSDNGPGVPAHLRDTVFDPGVSGRNSTGIGLFLSRSVLEEGSNTIVLDDQPSELGGAKFRVGSTKVLRPETWKSKGDIRLDRMTELAQALEAMTELVLDGYRSEAMELADLYEEAAGIAVRVKLRGPESHSEERLIASMEELDNALRMGGNELNAGAVPKL